MKSTTTFSWFRKLAIAEGISFLVLLFIAMPLKYFAGFPEVVTIFGGIHGVLFIGFMILTWQVKADHKKTWKWLGKAFIASILPFGTLVMDKQWKREESVDVV